MPLKRRVKLNLNVEQRDERRALNAPPANSFPPRKSPGRETQVSTPRAVRSNRGPV
jgi:hypothetical protein